MTDDINSRMKIYAVHGGCPDGLGAGWAVWSTLPGEVRKALMALGGGLCDKEKSLAVPAASTAAPAASTAATAATAAPAEVKGAAVIHVAPGGPPGTKTAADVEVRAPAASTRRWAEYIRLCRGKGLPAFIPLYRDEAPPIEEMEDADLTMIDYTSKFEELMQMVKVCNTVTVWDHHAGAEAIHAQVAELADNFRAFSDRDRSGAQIAWDMTHEDPQEVAKGGAPTPPPPRRPWIVDYIADRDLWRWALPDSKFISTGLHAGGHLRSFATVDALLAGGEELKAEIATAGRHISAYENALVSSICKGSVTIPLTIAGTTYSVRIVNASILRSEVGNRLAETHKVDFAIAWAYSHELNVYWLSFRASQASPLDMDRLARSWALAREGGGHPKAAGTTVDAGIHSIAALLKG